MLVSGGIDSTACVDFYLSQYFAVQALHVQYGQLSTKQEVEAARQVCLHYNVPLKVISCQGAQPKPAGLIHGRNAFLLFTALMESSLKSGLIAMGIHAGTSYTDCSKRFIQAVQAFVDDYTDGCLGIAAPFLEWSKQDIWRYCLERGVPLNLTYSCELGDIEPCGNCLSCFDLESLRALPKLNA